MLKRTTAQAKIAELKKRYRVVQGGTSASKTFSIIPLLIQYAIQVKNVEISIVAESIPHLRRGALRDFQKIMLWTNNWDDTKFNKSTLTYSFSNGSHIEFFSVDQPDKLRGARRDVLFINEANNVNFEAFQQLAIRTKKFVYIDYNPTSEFWAHTELISQPNTDFVKLTYKDNEALEPAIRQEIEAAEEKAKTSDYWRNWWQVYGLGEVGSLQGVVFDNWRQVDNVPEGAEYLGTGLDFGFTNDPTAAIDLYRYDGQVYLDEVVYQTGLLNNDIARLLKGKYIIADSAEPKSIAEMRRAGVNVNPADKGKDSINAGIAILQEYTLHVTARSLNLIKELRSYTWEKDRTGNKTNKPIDAFNHAIDALRYIAMKRLGNKKAPQYYVL
jgi:phage terminase large subunit